MYVHTDDTAQNFEIKRMFSSAFVVPTLCNSFTLMVTGSLHLQTQ